MHTTPHLHSHEITTVLGVWAHPDDETYLSAGLMTRVVRAGGRAECLHATVGEHGTSDPHLWPPHRLGPHRAGELRTALHAIGVQHHRTLGFPDGGCHDVEDGRAVDAIAQTIRRVRPDVVVTFGPDGITGHRDHVTVGRWTTAAWARTRRAALLYATTTEEFLARHHEVHRRLGLYRDAASVPDSATALDIRLSEEELDTKRRALAAHASQTEALATAMGEQTYRRWYDVESFRSATEADLQATTWMAGAA